MNTIWAKITGGVAGIFGIFRGFKFIGKIFKLMRLIKPLIKEGKEAWNESDDVLDEVKLAYIEAVPLGKKILEGSATEEDIKKYTQITYSVMKETVEAIKEIQDVKQVLLKIKEVMK